MTVEQIIAAKKTEREAKNLIVRLPGWIGYFKDKESRDDFIRRAKLAGQKPE